MTESRSSSGGTSSPRPTSRLTGTEPKPEPTFDWGDVDRLTESSKIVEGGFTVSDYGTRYGLPDSTARGQIRKMEREGKIKRIGYRGNGRRKEIVWDVVREATE